MTFWKDAEGSTEWSGAGRAVQCFCTGKCRTLGYCPANPARFPDKWVKPRIRVKAWRKPNEDNPESVARIQRAAILMGVRHLLQPAQLAKDTADVLALHRIRKWYEVE